MHENVYGTEVHEQMKLFGDLKAQPVIPPKDPSKTLTRKNRATG